MMIVLYAVLLLSVAAVVGVAAAVYLRVRRRVRAEIGADSLHGHEARAAEDAAQITEASQK